MNNLTQKQQYIVGVGFMSVILIVAIYMFAFSPQQAKKKENKTGIEELTGKLESANNTIAQKDEFEADLKTASAALIKFEEQMATGDAYVWMDSLIRANLKRYGHDVQIPNVGSPDPTGVGILPEFPYQAVSYTIQGSGHFHEIGKFIADFESDHPFIRVQNLVMAVKPRFGASEASEELNFSAALVALVKPEEEEEEETKK